MILFLTVFEDIFDSIDGKVDISLPSKTSENSVKPCQTRVWKIFVSQRSNSVENNCCLPIFPTKNSRAREKLFLFLLLLMRNLFPAVT